MYIKMNWLWLLGIHNGVCNLAKETHVDLTNKIGRKVLKARRGVQN